MHTAAKSSTPVSNIGGGGGREDLQQVLTPVLAILLATTHYEQPNLG